MELDELTHARVVIACVALAIALLWVANRAVQRRRVRRFAALAGALGQQVTVVSPFHSHFAVDLAERPMTVTWRHLGGGGGSSSGGAWRVITSTPLDGVSELHSTQIRRRWSLGRRPRGADFAELFAVRDFGLPLRPGWLSPRVEAAVVAFYELDLPLGELSIEEGCLVHRMFAELGKLDGGNLREMLSRQASLAAALERRL
jgi:hypothetical protein